MAAILPALVVVATGRTFVWRDTATLFAPVRDLVVEELRGGRLPLWNPYEGFGLPLHAQMIHGVLHPISLAHAWLASWSGMEGLVIAYLGFAALGAWVLARQLGCSPGAAAIAGITYGMGGYVQGLSAIVQLLAGAATAPWAVAGLRAAGRGTPSSLVAGSVGVAALHLAGDPQWTVAASLLGLALAAETGVRQGLRALGALALGSGLAAIQLVPSWRFLGETIREAGLSAEDQVQWAFAPARILELFSPGLFQGSPGAEPRAPVFLWLGGATQWNLLIPFLSSVHVGGTGLLMAGFGVGASRLSRVLSLASAMFLWLALGPVLGATQALGWVPILGAFRYAEKFVGPLTLCVSVLAAMGWQRLAGLPVPKAARTFLVAGVSALLLGVIFLVAASGWASEGVRGTAVEQATSAVGRGLLLTSLGALVVGGTLRVLHRGGSKSRADLVAAAVVVTSATVALPVAIRWAPRIPVPSSVGTHLRDPLVTRVATPLETMPPRNPLGLDAGDLEIQAKGLLGIASMNVWSRIDQAAPTIGLIPRNLRTIGDTFGPDVWLLLRRYGISHVVFPETDIARDQAIVGAAVQGGRLALHDRSWGIWAFQVPHRPYAYFSEAVTALPSPESVLGALQQAESSGSPETFVVGLGPWKTSPGEVIAMSRRSDSVEIEAVAAGDGVLVVADSYWPGWKATLDGRPTEILQADFLVRAVRWPAGRHVLRMWYDPPEMRLAWWVSAFSLVALSLVVVQVRRSSARPRQDG